MTQKKAIAAGHICVDITPSFQGKKVHSVGELLLPGKLINVGAATVSTGGSVANTGLAMKKLGADVSLMGKVGEDAFGKVILNVAAGYGAEGGMIVDPTSATSYSVVLAMPGVDRIFLHCTGANDTFCADDIPEEALKEASLFHFGYPPLMAQMYRDGGDGLLKVLQKAKQAGCVTSLDMAAVDPESEAGQEDWKQILEKILPWVDIFVPSVEELCFMLDREHYEAWNKRASGGDLTECLDLEKDVVPLADRLMQMGPGIIMIKCGVPGLYYRTTGADTFDELAEKLGLQTDEWAGREGFEKSFVPDQVLSGTGCGDTSIAAFLTSIMRGYSLEKSVALAAATGACCVASYDALGGLKSLDELERRIAAGWEKIGAEE